METLLAVDDVRVRGYRATGCALALDREEAAAYGDEDPHPADLVDELIEQAHASSSRVELVRDQGQLEGEPVAALLRF